jgi:hypothetical protein
VEAQLGLGEDRYDSAAAVVEVEHRYVEMRFRTVVGVPMVVVDAAAAAGMTTMSVSSRKTMTAQGKATTRNAGDVRV